MLITKSRLLFLYNPVFTQVRIFLDQLFIYYFNRKCQKNKNFYKIWLSQPYHSNTLVDRFQIWCLYFLFERQRKKNFRTMPRGLSIHAVYLYTSITSVILYSTVIIKHSVPKFEIQLFQLRFYEYFLREYYIGLRLHSNM